jgi:ABC-2 type transport system permease protein
MIVLSMAFLCGVFIQTELLDDTIVAISHFLPLYWYVQATNYINAHALGEIFSMDFLTYLAMQLVFAAIFFVAGLIISRKKEQYAI